MTSTLLGYARVSTGHQDLARQVAALEDAGVAADRVWCDTRTGATMDRPGLGALRAYARAGDVVVVHQLDRLGRNLSEVLALVEELTGAGIGLRTLADPVPIDTTGDQGTMGRVALLLLALFGEMERTYARERASHARAVAAAQGRQVGRPRAASDVQIEHARLLRAGGASLAEISRKTSLPKTSLHRYLTSPSPSPSPSPSTSTGPGGGAGSPGAAPTVPRHLQDLYPPTDVPQADGPHSPAPPPTTARPTPAPEEAPE